MTREEIKRLSKIDAIYGLAALTLLGVGLTLWFCGVGKPIAFFAIIGLLSIYPTVFFLKNRSDQNEMIKIPTAIFWMLRVELLLLSIIPLLAGLMARGVGFFG